MTTDKHCLDCAFWCGRCQKAKGKLNRVASDPECFRFEPRESVGFVVAFPKIEA